VGVSCLCFWEWRRHRVSARGVDYSTCRLAPWRCFTARRACGPAQYVCPSVRPSVAGLKPAHRRGVLSRLCRALVAGGSPIVGRPDGRSAGVNLAADLPTNGRSHAAAIQLVLYVRVCVGRRSVETCMERADALAAGAALCLTSSGRRHCNSSSSSSSARKSLSLLQCALQRAGAPIELNYSPTRRRRRRPCLTCNAGATSRSVPPIDYRKTHRCPMLCAARVQDLRQKLWQSATHGKWDRTPPRRNTLGLKCFTDKAELNSL